MIAASRSRGALVRLMSGHEPWIMAWFTAQMCDFAFDELLNVLAFLLAEFPDGSGSRFEMLRSATFDEHDRACGTDTYRLVIDSGPTHYGGVIGWLIDEANVLRITLDANAADALGTPAVEIALQPTDRALARHAMSVLTI